MKFIIMSIIVLMHLPVWGQPGKSPKREQAVEQCTETVYTITGFKRIADSLQMSVGELSDYPVIFPVKKPVISSGFGIRKHPVYKVRMFHTGIDITQVKGTSVYATGNGVVTRKGYNTGYGYYIEIRHACGFRSFYAHLSKTMVNTGDPVSIMQQIGCVGDTGVTTGSHLHYEVRKGKGFLNPAGWCCCLLELLNNDL